MSSSNKNGIYSEEPLEESSRVMRETRYIPVTKWPKYHSWPSINSLRHYIFLEKENGFDNVIKRVGRRILIDESAFFAWVKNQPDSK